MVKAVYRLHNCISVNIVCYEDMIYGIWDLKAKSNEQDNVGFWTHHWSLWASFYNLIHFCTTSAGVLVTRQCALKLCVGYQRWNCFCLIMCTHSYFPPPFYNLDFTGVGVFKRLNDVVAFSFCGSVVSPVLLSLPQRSRDLMVTVG